jgi:8-oxo-dGTP diphosphatase
MKVAKEKTRTPILAAGGIVVRHDGRPTIAVVQLRKMSTWMLPKGKLAAAESAIAAARREVLEETGHRVSIHEFLGTLAYEAGGRPKIVHFWRMQALGGPVGPLMRDVKAVEWLPLDAAIGRLTHVREKAFLEQVGPAALRRAVRPQRKSVLRHPRTVPVSQPVLMPELVAPVDFAAPLPADNLARVVSPPLVSRPIERAAAATSLLEKNRIEDALIEKNLLEKTIGKTIEKTWDWLRYTARQPKPPQA